MTADSHEHDWSGRRDDLPRGYAVQCTACQAWLVVPAGESPVTGAAGSVILSQQQIDRALAILRTDQEIRDLPVTGEERT